MAPVARFGWTELCAADPDGAARFFARLLGWERGTQALVQGARSIEYVLFALRGRNVGGMYAMVGAQRKRGMRPQWLSHLFVDDLPGMLQRAQGLGAVVLAQPMVVFDLGRLALLRDPQGALFGLWQPLRLGADFQTRDEPGYASWFEHASSDPGGAARFYAELCGWQPGAPAAPSGRATLVADGRPVAGFSAALQDGEALPPQWLTFFRVADVAVACRELAGLRGTVLVPPQGTPAAGDFALARDPQGAPFGLVSAPAAR